MNGRCTGAGAAAQPLVPCRCPIEEQTEFTVTLKEFGPTKSA